MTHPSKRRIIKQSTPNRIRSLYSKKGVTILFDVPDSNNGQIGSPYTWDKTNKILTIIPGNIDEREKEDLLNVIKEIFEAGYLLWKASKKEVLNSYIKYSEDNDDQKILAFFNPILSPNDFSALKMSLYLRAQHKSGYEIHGIKSDIIDRFGDRGANIANLCTAGYFEEEFMPLYNSASQKEFYEYYEIAVGKKARALFVHSGMTEGDIEKEVHNTYSKAVQYSMKEFRLHGIGKINVQNIKNFVRSREGDEGYFIRKDYENEVSHIIEYTIQIV